MLLVGALHRDDAYRNAHVWGVRTTKARGYKFRNPY